MSRRHCYGNSRGPLTARFGRLCQSLELEEYLRRQCALRVQGFAGEPQQNPANLGQNLIVTG